MKLGVACDGWEIKSSDDIEEVAKLQCEPVEHEGCSVCDPLEINTGIPCYKTVFVEELPEAGISGILYVTKRDDEYSIYEWDGSIFVNVTSPASCTLQTKTVTPAASQVEYLPDSGYDGFDKVTVEAIPSEYIVPSGTKNITANGNAQDVKSYEKVNVNVPNSYAASDEGKVVQSGALVSQSSQTVTENGTYDTTTKNEVVVEVPTPIMDTLLADANGTFHAPEGVAFDEVIVDVTRLIEGYVDFRVTNLSSGLNSIVAVPTDDGSKPGLVPLRHFWVESNKTETIPVPIIHGEAYVYFHQNGQPPHYPIPIFQSFCTYDPNTGSARADNPLDGRTCELVMRY